MRIRVVVRWCWALVVLGNFTGWAQEKSGKDAKPETLVRWHFGGTAALQKKKNLKTVEEVLAMPETTRLRDAMLNKAAALSAKRFTRRANDTNATQATVALIRPLLLDLVQAESRLELSTTGDRSADWMVAIRLAADRAQLWSTNLWQLVSSARLGKPAAAHLDGQPGWIAEGDGYRVAFSRSKDWVIIEGGHSALDTHARTFASLRKSLGKRESYVLRMEVNFPELGELWDAPKLAHGPKVTLTATSKSGGLRSDVQMDYPRELGITPEKWRVPKDLIRDPLIGFNALQGFQERLSQSKRFTRLAPEKVPNQLFVWSQAISPFSVSFATDVGNPEEIVGKLATEVGPKLQQKITQMGAGGLTYLTNRSVLLWQGLPILVPFLRPAPAPYGDYLLGGLFPLADESKPTNPAPAELFAQLNKRNLIYYEWEITQDRIRQWRPIWQLTRIIPNRPIPVSSAPSEAWLQAVGIKLGNTVTEVVLDGKSRLKLTRQSHLGFNGMELVWLAHVADSEADVSQVTEEIPLAPPQNQQSQP